MTHRVSKNFLLNLNNSFLPVYYKGKLAGLLLIKKNYCPFLISDSLTIQYEPKIQNAKVVKTINSFHLYPIN